jgi:hypothetical protein
VPAVPVLVMGRYGVRGQLGQPGTPPQVVDGLHAIHAGGAHDFGYGGV